MIASAKFNQERLIIKDNKFILPMGKCIIKARCIMFITTIFNNKSNLRLRLPT
jgi:hypothetical protein